MTPNKLPPLPDPSDDDLPVPIAYGMRRKGEISVIGVVPNKVHVKPATSETYLREFEEVALFTAEQLHAAREQAFHDGQCQALRQSQSLPAGAVAVYQMMAIDQDDDDKRVWMDMSREDYERLNGRPDVRSRILYTDLPADAREKGEAVDLERFRELPAKWLHERTEMASARRGHNPHNEGIIATLDRCARELEARLIATQPAQASEKDLSDEQEARMDARVYGSGFLVDGKRVDPSTVTIIRGEDVSYVSSQETASE